MRTNVNRKAVSVAILPAVMIPVEQTLQAHHAPDVVVGLFAGVVIGLMILLLIFAIRGQNCDAAG